MIGEEDKANHSSYRWRQSRLQLQQIRTEVDVVLVPDTWRRSHLQLQQIGAWNSLRKPKLSWSRIGEGEGKVVSNCSRSSSLIYSFLLTLCECRRIIFLRDKSLYMKVKEKLLDSGGANVNVISISLLWACSSWEAYQRPGLSRAQLYLGLGRFTLQSKMQCKFTLNRETTISC